MRITLNPEEKEIIKKYHKINLKVLCLPEDYYGHYWIESTDKGTFVRAKKRGIVTSSNTAFSKLEKPRKP